ncbi:unnamed protein product [Ceutorhynchus assimilis]|uniref:C-type lectin domain-containing protein n=1 Tax=Ceutorhynchus assimilis TaxID=467358 RepID=A0A9N9QJ16_9CUCU|nr:unnamed protein product [Ceutorhynchus assimilis]
MIAYYHFVFVTLFLLADIIECQKYVVSLEPVNWYQALINCKNAGMELASIHSEQEQNDLDKFLRTNGYDKGYWLAGTKEGNGQFYWATTGTKMIYTKWLDGQPDDAKFDTNFYEGEHCVCWGFPSYRPEPIGWNDMTCFNNISYICQRFEYCFI